jgi:hypothetical protein
VNEEDGGVTVASSTGRGGGDSGGLARGGVKPEAGARFFTSKKEE